MVQITNGTVKYGQTVKTGDFENKRADVELSFNVAEGQDVEHALEHVRGHALRHLHTILNIGAPTPAAKAVASLAPKAEETTEAPSKKPRAAKIPAAVKTEVADAAAMVEEPAEKAPTFLGKKEASAAEVVEDDNDLGDIMGETVKEITDKELMDATAKRQQEVQNGPAIRKILPTLGINPPGRIIDLPQNKRQEYLDKLKEIKPLA